MTPYKIDKDVERLLKKLGASHEPIYLDIKPEPGTLVNDCFPIVQEKVKKFGGRMIMGWQIWKSKHLIEAECHAVWEDPNEELHDITPKDIEVTNILFVEDDKLVYEEKQIDNIRLNITTNKLVDDLIKVCIAIYRFDNKGERAVLYDLNNILNEKQKEHKIYLMQLQNMINVILNNNGNRDSLCPCKSGLKFNKCHRKDMDVRILKDI